MLGCGCLLCLLCLRCLLCCGCLLGCGCLLCLLCLRCSLCCRCFFCSHSLLLHLLSCYSLLCRRRLLYLMGLLCLLHCVHSTRLRHRACLSTSWSLPRLPCGELALQLAHVGGVGWLREMRVSQRSLDSIDNSGIIPVIVIAPIGLEYSYSWAISGL